MDWTTASRLPVKAIFEPSGDHAGSRSPPTAPLVSLVSPVPSAFITARSATPLLKKLVSKAILLPSGDQTGLLSFPARGVERLIRFAPLASITKMERPDDSKTILPSAAGDGEKICRTPAKL